MRWVPALACAAVAWLAATAGPAAAAPVYGVQGLGTSGPGVLGADLAVARRLDAKITRIEASWAELQPGGPAGPPDAAALRVLDRHVDAAAAQGIGVVLFVNRTPCWASSAPAAIRRGCRGPDRVRNRFAVTRYSPRRVAEAVPISRLLVSRYRAKLTAFEVWNEPDQGNEKFWAGPRKVEKYVALVKALYRPLKAAAPALPVLAGSFVGLDGRWLKAMYAQGVKGYYDGLAVHFYTLPLFGLAHTRLVQEEAGDTKPLWLTEFGWSTCARPGGPAAELGHACVTPATQAQNLVDLVRSVRELPWLEATIEYDLADRARSFAFGLLDVQRREKPAFRAALLLQRGGAPAVSRPTVVLRVQGRQAIATGTASGADVLDVEVTKDGTPRLTGTVAADRFRRWRLALPASLGTTGLRITVRGRLVGGSATAGVS